MSIGAEDVVCETVTVGGRALDDALAAARAGDEWGITCLFRALQPSLLRYLNRQAPGAADDLASETWLSAARRLPGFEGSPSDFRALLFTIARRRVVDGRRRWARRPALQPLDLEHETSVDPDPGAEDAALGLISSEQAIALLVETLPAAQAEVVLLRVVADLTTEETARVMGRSEGAVRVLQHRALRQLAKHFAREGVTK
ncbi:MAG: RNA polymerase sigma factor [Acidimicrobiales bacterium]